jgi:multicomponent Na+:H+ antiporter subunit D
VLVLTPVLVPLATAILVLLAGERAGARRALSLGGALALLGCTTALLAEVQATGRVGMALGDWPLPFAIEIAADRLGAALALVTALLGVAVVLQQSSSADAAPEAPGLHALVHGLLAAVGAAFVTADLFNLYVWFELMLVTALGLLAYGGEARHLDACLKYLVLQLIGTLLLLLAVALVYGATGQLNLAALAGASGTVPPVAVALLVLAFLVKAGAFPFFSWLPASYHTLPAPVLALFGGLLSKVGVYAVLRTLGDVYAGAPALFYEALGWIASVTMVVGVLGAAYHWDLRRILAFHVVSQVGYMLLGIALATSAGAAATIFFTLHNILAKAVLLLIAGIAFRAGGHYDLRRTGGLSAGRPLLAVLFLLSALSLVGIPPLWGFWAKFVLVREVLLEGHYLWAATALGVSALTLYSMAKIWVEAFWKPHPAGRDTGAPARGLVPAYAATTALTLAVVAVGVAPDSLLRFSAAAALSLRVGVWATP